MSIEAFVKEWLSGGEDRHLRVKHGGEGGLFYVLREDADDNDAERDGVGKTIADALEDCFSDLRGGAKP